MGWESVPDTLVGAHPARMGESVSLCWEKRNSGAVSVEEDLQENIVRGEEGTVTLTLVRMGQSVIIQRRQG